MADNWHRLAEIGGLVYLSQIVGQAIVAIATRLWHTIPENDWSADRRWR